MSVWKSQGRSLLEVRPALGRGAAMLSACLTKAYGEQDVCACACTPRRRQGSHVWARLQLRYIYSRVVATGYQQVSSRRFTSLFSVSSFCSETPRGRRGLRVRGPPATQEGRPGPRWGPTREGPCAQLSLKGWGPRASLRHEGASAPPRPGLCLRIRGQLAWTLRLIRKQRDSFPAHTRLGD